MVSACVVAMENERRHVNGFQIFGKVAFRESLGPQVERVGCAVIACLHPIVHRRLRDRDTWSAENRRTGR